jgi:hypothetical protein
MEHEGRRTIRVIILILLLFAVGVVGLGTRYKTVAMNDKVLMVERWTGRALFIYSDGSTNVVESSRSLRGPFLMSKTSPSYAGVQFRGKLKWRSGKTYFLVTSQPYNDVLKSARKNRKRQLVIDLMDREGFVVKTLWIPVSKMSALQNGEGETTSLEYRVAVSMCIQDFRDIKNWKVR